MQVRRDHVVQKASRRRHGGCMEPGQSLLSGFRVDSNRPCGRQTKSNNPRLLKAPDGEEREKGRK